MANKLTNSESTKIHSTISNESSSAPNCPPDPTRMSSTLQRTMNGALTEPKPFSRGEYVEPKSEVKSISHSMNPPWYDELEKPIPVPAVQSQPLFASEQPGQSGKRIPFTPTPQDSNYVVIWILLTRYLWSLDIFKWREKLYYSLYSCYSLPTSRWQSFLSILRNQRTIFGSLVR